MTQDEIIEMAIEAGLAFYMYVGKEEIQAFAHFVAAKAFQDGYEKGIAAFTEAVNLEREACAKVAWGVDWGRAGDIPCVSIIKRLPNGGIKVVAVEYAPYTFKEKNSA